MRDESELRLRDGRRLAYCEYGAPEGAPAFFFSRFARLAA
jgi:hypothetical protein